MALDFSRLTVVVADDGAFMRSLFRDILLEMSFAPGAIIEAADGSEALELMRDREVDLVICDLNMRPMSGLQLTRFIRIDPASPDPYLPVIICTAHAEQHYIETARDAGAHEILRKPFSPKTLYQRIHSIVTSSRPFVHAPGYTGPDRRRRNVPFDEPDRRISTVEID
jgi:two-component system, chemotaxis family, chemotaxis protein CheY